MSFCCRPMRKSPVCIARMVVFNLDGRVVRKKSFGSARLAMNVVCSNWSGGPGFRDAVMSTALSTTVLGYRQM